MGGGILPPELKSVQQLMAGDVRYYVPKYQRNFAWKQDEIEEFWEDLLAAIDRTGDYFLGTIVLLQRTSQRRFEIIDGQQRLTCISMIFSAARNVFKSRSDPRGEQLFSDFLGARGYSRGAITKPKLELNKVNNETYLRHIVESENYDKVGETLKSRVLHESNRLLLEAYSFFLDRVTVEAGRRGTDFDAFLEPLVDCLRESLKLITIPVMSDEDANLFFESLNARGKELAVSDLVKNRLYSEARDQVNRAQDLWEKMEADLGRRPIPEYLRHYWIAKRADKQSLLVRETKLYRAVVGDVKAKTIEVRKKKTIELLKDLNLSAADYAKINDYSAWPDNGAYDENFEEALDELEMFRVAQCNPLLLNAIQRFNSPTEIARTFRIISNFSFRYNIIGRQSPGNLERESGKIAYDIRTGTYTLARHVADALRAINPDSNFRSDFELAILPKSRAKLARYILRKINDHMASRLGKTGVELRVNPNAKKVNLEHVLPQHPTLNWISTFSNRSEAEAHVYRIGNLTLLTKSVNKDSANKSFKDKQKIALKDSKLLINEYIKNATSWGADEIEKRQKDLAIVAVDVWRI
jgi:hypothetical protein